MTSGGMPPDLHKLADAISTASPNTRAFAEAVADILQPVSAPTPAPVMGAALDAFLPRLGPSDSGRTVEVPLTTKLATAVHAASPGDRLVLRGGKRVDDVEIAHFPREHPISISEYPGERVTFTGPVHGLYFGDVSGVVLDLRGMEATGCGNDGIKLDNVCDFEAIGGESHHNATNGELVGGQGSASPANWTNKLSRRVRIDGLKVHHNGTSAQYHGSYFGGGSAYSTTQAGVDTFLFVNCEGFAISGGYVFQFGGMAQNGIVANCSGDLFGVPKSTRGGAPGIFVVYNQSDQPWPTKYVLFVNNLGSNSPNNAFQGSGGKDMSTNVVRNNMGWKNELGSYAPKWGTTQVFTLGMNYADADPMYVAPGSDLHLRDGSPARGKGDIAFMPPHDRDGKQRAIATLGAYA